MDRVGGLLMDSTILTKVRVLAEEKGENWGLTAGH